ncbi:mRNA-binding phosphate metabolism regulator, partial [Ascoidea rubescens DSM 1968]
FQIPQIAKFFVIKSFNLYDIQQAFLNKVWSSTELGNKRLNQTFNLNYPVYLFFSVNGSGKFCGIAQMLSNVVYDSKDANNEDIWFESDKYKGFFKINFIFIKDLNFKYFKNLKLINNFNKSVTNSRDTQELPYEIGYKMVEAFKFTNSNSSFLQTLMK